MRAIWIDAGNDADYAKLSAYGIDSPYYAATDPRVTLAYLEGVRARGFNPGIYAAWNWQPLLGGVAFANWLDSRLVQIAPATPFDFPKVCVDIETHDVAYILAFLKRWRAHRPTRVTDWTLEALQGGLFAGAPVQAIVKARVGVVPQNYTGNMSPLAADRVALDLVSFGFPWSILHGFYDGAALPSRWDGYVFTQGRLP